MKLDQSAVVEPGGPVAAFCAVGNPESFFQLVDRSGYELVSKTKFPDHHVYSPQDLQDLETDARNAGANALITTAKDGVKLNSNPFSLPCYVMEIELQVDNAPELKRMIVAGIRGQGPGSEASS